VNIGMCVISQGLIATCLHLLPATKTILHRSESQKQCPIWSPVKVMCHVNQHWWDNYNS